MPEHHKLQKISSRAGVFDGRIVQGFEFEDERGIRAWHITTWTTDRNVIENYWIEGDKFFEVLCLYLDPPLRIETGRLIVDTDERKRTVILNALGKWEQEELAHP